MTTDIYNDGGYFANNPDWHAGDSEWKADQILKIIRKNNIETSTICEVGFGAGEILNQLHAKMTDGIEFTGYEISAQALEIAKPKEKPGLRYVLGDILEEDVCHDVLLCIDVFEHVEDHFSFLRNIRPKADYKVFHIPLELSAQSVIRRGFLPTSRRQLGHLHYFSKDTALMTLEETGYEVVDHFYTYSSGVNLSQASLKQKLAWPARLALSAINEDLAARILGGFALMVLAK
jgi:hypothetical protein